MIVHRMKGKVHFPAWEEEAKPVGLEESRWERRQI